MIPDLSINLFRPIFADFWPLEKKVELRLWARPPPPRPHDRMSNPHSWIRHQVTNPFVMVGHSITAVIAFEFIELDYILISNFKIELQCNDTLF